MMLCSQVEAVSKFQEIELSREYGYVIFRILHSEPQKISVMNEMKMDQFKNEHDLFLVNKMDIILSNWFRILKDHQYLLIKTISSIVKPYIEIRIDAGTYSIKLIQAFLKDIYTNYANDCCFSILNINHRLLFIRWSPDAAKAKDKMRHTCNAESFRSACDIVPGYHTIQASDRGELDEEVIRVKAFCGRV